MGTTSPAPGEEPRAFLLEGEGWVAELLGSTSAGTSPDVRAPLILVGFRRMQDAESPEREALAPGLGLDDLSDDELVELLARARPIKGADPGAEAEESVSM